MSPWQYFETFVDKNCLDKNKTQTLSFEARESDRALLRAWIAFWKRDLSRAWMQVQVHIAKLLHKILKIISVCFQFTSTLIFTALLTTNIIHRILHRMRDRLQYMRSRPTLLVRFSLINILIKTPFLIVCGRESHLICGRVWFDTSIRSEVRWQNPIWRRPVT